MKFLFLTLFTCVLSMENIQVGYAAEQEYQLQLYNPLNEIEEANQEEHTEKPDLSDTTHAAIEFLIAEIAKSSLDPTKKSALIDLLNTTAHELRTSPTDAEMQEILSENLVKNRSLFGSLKKIIQKNAQTCSRKAQQCFKTIANSHVCTALQKLGTFYSSTSSAYYGCVALQQFLKILLSLK